MFGMTGGWSVSRCRQRKDAQRLAHITSAKMHASRPRKEVYTGIETKRELVKAYGEKVKIVQPEWRVQ